eukprot:9458514-Ditylum_brightwellii.AAC.1
MHDPPTDGKRDDSYCKKCLINSEKADHRTDDKSKAKKTMVCISLINGQGCSFKVVVEWDNNGFYIDSKCSVSTHKYHPRGSVDCMYIPTRIIPTKERENLITLADACVGKGVGGNFIYSKLGKYILNAKKLK